MVALLFLIRRYLRPQVAVTTYKEAEQRSSSMYNFEEPFDPVFSLQDYIDDDEEMVDKVGRLNYYNLEAPSYGGPEVQTAVLHIKYFWPSQRHSLAAQSMTCLMP